MTPTERKTLLRQRTKAFASLVVRFYCGLDKKREELLVLGKQLLRSGTSVAANYREADDGAHGAEMASTVGWTARRAEQRWVPAGHRCSQTQLWIELLREDCGVDGSEIVNLHQECDEILAIFTSMVSKLRRKAR